MNGGKLGWEKAFCSAKCRGASVENRVHIYKWKGIHPPRSEEDDEYVKVIRYRFPDGIDTIG